MGAAAPAPAAGAGGDPNAPQAPVNPADTEVPDHSKTATPGTAQPTTPIRALRRNNQTCSFKKEQRLTGEEKIFKKEMLEKEMGLNKTTGKEVFRQGIHGFEAIAQFSEDNINHLVSMMKKSTSPFCVEPQKFFIQALFQTKLGLTSKWIECQKIIGGDPTELGWAAQSNPMKASASRLDCHEKRSSSSDEEPSDFVFPRPSENVKHWNSFSSEEFEACLQKKQGVAMVPPSHIIGPKSEELVSQSDRDGEVGAFQKHADWDEHERRCTELKGEHCQTDNQAVLATLAKLVRDGPGWSCIKGCKKRGSGNDRKAHCILENHCRTSHVLHNEAQTAGSVTFRTTWDNSSRNWTLHDCFEKRTKAKAALEKLKQSLGEEVCVQEHSTGISDDVIQLIGAKSVVRQAGSQFEEDFEATMNFFHSTWQSCNGTKGHAEDNMMVAMMVVAVTPSARNMIQTSNLKQNLVRGRNGSSCLKTRGTLSSSSEVKPKGRRKQP